MLCLSKTTFANLDQELRRGHKTEDTRRIDRKKFLWWFGLTIERHIGDLIAKLRKIDGKRRLRSARYANENDIRFREVLRVATIIMVDREIHRSEAAEVLIVD